VKRHKATWRSWALSRRTDRLSTSVSPPRRCGRSSPQSGSPHPASSRQNALSSPGKQSPKSQALIHIQSATDNSFEELEAFSPTALGMTANSKILEIVNIPAAARATMDRYQFKNQDLTPRDSWAHSLTLTLSRSLTGLGQSYAMMPPYRRSDKRPRARALMFCTVYAAAPCADYLTAIDRARPGIEG